MKLRYKNNDKTTYVPDWYWSHGLHDAHIISVCQLTIPIDWKKQECARNCLEINLDAEGALYESDVEKILLYDYKILTAKFDISRLNNTWWLKDELVEWNTKHWKLSLVAETSEGVELAVEICFDKAETLFRKY